MLTKKYDFRGPRSYLTDSLVRSLATGFGLYAAKRGIRQVVLAMDANPLSKDVLPAVRYGLLDSGMSVFEFSGPTTSPALYYASLRRAGVMVTASHLGAGYAGMKPFLFDRTLVESELAEVEAGARCMRLNGELHKCSDSTYLQSLTQACPRGEKRVVIDCSGGMAGEYAARVLSSLGHAVKRINRYAYSAEHRSVDPSKHTADLSYWIKEWGADYGFIFDADGDRLGVVDMYCQVVDPESIILAFWQDVCSSESVETAPIDIRSGLELIGTLTTLGVDYKFIQAGHSAVKKEMIDNGYAFAGEPSGHYYFKKWFCIDDAVYACARLLSLYIKAATKYYKIPDQRTYDEQSVKKVASATDYLCRLGIRCLTIDGVRAMTEDGWILIRASGTEPVLNTKGEATTEDGRDRLTLLMKRAIA